MEKPDSTMEVNHMETTMNNPHTDTTAPIDEAPQPNAAARPTPRAGRPGDDLVRWAEFRLPLWMGGFALAVIISGQGFLYSAIMDLQGEMQTQFGELRERIVRIETHLSMDAGSVEKAN